MCSLPPATPPHQWSLLVCCSRMPPLPQARAWRSTQRLRSPGDRNPRQQPPSSSRKSPAPSLAPADRRGQRCESFPTTRGEPGPARTAPLARSRPRSGRRGGAHRRPGRWLPAVAPALKVQDQFKKDLGSGRRGTRPAALRGAALQRSMGPERGRSSIALMCQSSCVPMPLRCSAGYQWKS